MSSSESVICVVQARMGSTRLPGKVLMDLGGQPMLGFLLDRLSRLDVQQLVVATSDGSIDDPIVALCEQRSVAVVRGSEADVLGRFLTALDRYPADHVVRITADCPFTDPDIVRNVIARHIDTSADYTSNVFPRTFPKGLDVEVVRADALRIAGIEAKDPAEREHVTPFLYRHPERFRLANLRSGMDLGDEWWTVDTEQDIDAMRSMLGTSATGPAPLRPDFTWQEMLGVVGRQPVDPGLLRLRPATGDDSELLLRWRNDTDSVRFSGSGQGIDAADHDAWFERVINDPSAMLLMAERTGGPQAPTGPATAVEPATPVGMVRVDVADATGVVSIAVAPEHRGHGLANDILGLLTARVSSGVQIDRLLADIHVENVGSQRSFHTAGFVPIGTDDDFCHYVWTTPRVGPERETGK